MGFQRVAHCTQVLGGRATTTANDAGAGVERHLGVNRHQLGRAVVADGAIDILRDTAIALGHQHHLRPHRFSQVMDAGHHFGRANTAIGTAGRQSRHQGFLQAGKVAGRDAHHGATIGVKTQGADDRQAYRGRAGYGRFDLLFGGHRLQPQHIHPASGQATGLLGERLLGQLKAQGPDGLHDFAGRSHAAGNCHHAAARIRHLTCQAGSRFIEFGHARLSVVQLEAISRTAKAIGQNDVSAGVDKTLMQCADAVGMLNIPKFRGVARHQADIKQVAAGGAIGQQPRARCQQAGKTVRGWRSSLGSGHGHSVEDRACGQGDDFTRSHVAEPPANCHGR